MLDAFAAAAQEAGIPHTDDFNRGDNEGVGYFDVNQRAGMRWNATKAFLRPIERRPNLQVWTGAHIDRVELDGDGRAIGVRVAPVGGGAAETATLAPGGEVILATGAIGTPQILQLSGIGPAPLLQAHGIAVRRELAGVGENLQDHLQIRAVFGVEGVQTLNAPGELALGQGEDRPALRLEAQRADEHGAVAARRLHPQPPGAAASQPRVPRAAALARRLRRAAASLRRLHRERVQPQSDEPRHGADPLAPRSTTRRASRPTTSPPTTTAWSPPRACA